MTTLREAAQQALEALENGKRVRACEGGTKFQIPLEDNAITALRAALAQEPTKGAWHDGVLEGQLRERERWLAQQDEPLQEPVDVGLLEYRGNSVAFIHQKMTAYRDGIDAAWDAFRANGLHPDGKTSLADMIAKHTAPPQRQPLAEWQINDLMADIDPEDVCSWSFRQGVYAAEKHHGVKP